MADDIIFNSLQYKYKRVDRRKRCAYTYNNTSCCNKTICDHLQYCDDHLCYKCDVYKRIIIHEKDYKLCLAHYLHLLSIDDEKRLDIIYRALVEMKYYDNLTKRYEDLMIGVKNLQDNICYNYNDYICLVLMTIGVIDRTYMLKCVSEEHQIEWA